MEEESRLARSEPDFGGEKKTEVRFEAKNAYLAILDGYCSGTGKCRMSVINGLLEDWAKAKAREAMMVCRVAGINPTSPDGSRK